MSQILCGDIKNFSGKAQLVRDKFSFLVNQNNGLNQPGVEQRMYLNSINELKKMDLFDLGVVLTISATGGLDTINEEHLTRLTDFTSSCCFIHALEEVDT